MTIEYKNASLDEIAAALKDRDNFVICGHVNPDGDCISTQAALTLTLLSLGKNVVNLLADCSAVDVSLQFLPGVDKFVYAKESAFEPSEIFCGAAYTFVSVDVPLKRRVGKYAPTIKEAADFTITIDHHEPEDLDSNLVFSDPTAASCSLLIWELLPHLGVKPSVDIATSCLCGVISDTGSFRYQNADVRCFMAAAHMVESGADPAVVSANLYQKRSINSLKLQARTIEHMYVDHKLRFAVSFLNSDDFEEFDATKDDADFMVDMLRSMDVVDVVCMMRQEHACDEVHGSLRSKTDIDVSQLARQYVGGGHKAAAGFTMKGVTDLPAAFEEIKQKLTQLMK